jgi:phage gpG-like protein
MTTITIQMDGIEALTRQLAGLGGDANKIMHEAVTRLAIDTHNFAKEGIQRGPKSGRVYGKRGHRASAPGEYPASDTGRLASSVTMILPAAVAPKVTAVVGTDVMYGKYLEFGTSRMAARPWLLPSWIKAKAKVEMHLKAQIAKLGKKK